MAKQGCIGKLHIDYLANHRDCIPTLAQWHLQEWGYLNPGAGLTQHIKKLQRLCNIQQIPTAFIAVYERRVIGSASLVAHDILRNQAMTPWLASVYVAPAFRQRGVGTCLVNRGLAEARKLGYRYLYLFTPDREYFYHRLGWLTLREVMIKGHPMTVMANKIAME